MMKLPRHFVFKLKKFSFFQLFSLFNSSGRFGFFLMVWTHLLELDPATYWYTNLAASRPKRCPGCKSPSPASATSQVREQKAFATGKEQGRPMEQSKTLAWLLSPFSVHLSSTERAQHFLENPEPLVHSPSTAVFAEGTDQPLILPNHGLLFSFSFCFFSRVLLPFSSPEDSWYYLRSRCNIHYCFPHQAT